MVNKKHTKLKWFKRFCFTAIGFVCLLSFVLFLFEKSIGQRILSEANHQLTTQLTAGDVSLSLLRSFPNISLEVKKVSLQGTDEQQMFKAATLQFRFGLFSLFSEEMEIKSIVVKNGVVLLKVDKAGKRNFDILKKSDEKSDSKVGFHLQKATFENCIVGYEDILAAQNLGFTIQKASIKGNFSPTIFDITSEAQLLTHGCTIGKNTFLEKNTLQYSSSLTIDWEKKHYLINQFRLSIEKNTFDVLGEITQRKKASDIDLAFSGVDCELGSLFQLLPSQYRNHLSDIKSSGKVNAMATVKGTFSSKSTPAINATLSVANATLKNRKLLSAFENISFNASFNNGTAHTMASSELSIPDFQGYFDEQLLTSRLQINGLNDPLIYFYLDGKIPVKTTCKFFKENSTDGDGFFYLKNISVNGFWEDMQSAKRIQSVKMSGSIFAENAQFIFPNGDILIPEAACYFDNNTFLLEKMNLQSADSDVALNGSLQNFLPVLLSDSLHQSENLTFKLTLGSKRLNINQLKNTFSDNSNTTKNKNLTVSSKKTTPLWQRLDGVFQAKINQFAYQKIQGKKFNGTLRFDGKQITMDGNVAAMGGDIQMNARIDATSAPDLAATIACKNIDTPTFFEQCDNFGQKIITNQQISGSLNANLAIDGQWNENKVFLEDKLLVLGYVTIENGVMKDVKMLEDFSTYVKIEDLKQIKFTTLENWFEIRNGWLYLPAMQLRNNALNMTVCGSHSFKNDIDYNIRLNAAQVVFNRFKKYNPSLSPQKDIEDEGLFDLFFNMHGDLDNYKIEPSKKYVRGEFERSILRKKEVQNKLDARIKGKDFDLETTPVFAITPKVTKIPKTKQAPPVEKIKPKVKPIASVLHLPKTYKPKVKSKKTEEEIAFLEGF